MSETPLAGKLRPGGAPAAQRGFWRSLPTWKKILVGASSALAVSGGGLTTYNWLQAPPEPAPGPVGSFNNPTRHGGGSSFLPGEPRAGELPTGRAGSDPAGEPAAGEQAAAEGPLGEWSPALLKGGLSFLIGFSIGFAVRTFIKLAALVLGLAFLVIFGLMYAGVIDPINWTAVEGRFQGLMEGLRAQAAGFQTFLTGNLPSAGMAGLGLFTGFKKS